MLRFIYWLVSKFSSEPSEYTLVELYDDSLWPWLRCFGAMWLTLLCLWGFGMWYECSAMNTYKWAYASGMMSFWWFYVPVFGFMMQLSYYTHSGDGFWTSGPSWVFYVSNWLNDMFS